jgi:alanine dehydrogenase
MEAGRARRSGARAKGVNVLDGKITYKPVAEAHGMDYTPLEDHPAGRVPLPKKPSS